MSNTSSTLAAIFLSHRVKIALSWCFVPRPVSLPIFYQKYVGFITVLSKNISSCIIQFPLLKMRYYNIYSQLLFREFHSFASMWALVIFHRNAQRWIIYVSLILDDIYHRLKQILTLIHEITRHFSLYPNRITCFSCAAYSIYIKACHWLSSWYLLDTDSQTSYNDFVIDNIHSFQLQFQMTTCIDKHITIYDCNR